MPTAGLRKPQRTTTTEQAYQSILAAILDGSIPAGAPLRLQELAEGLGMSMMPIREAIRQLESVGVIESAAHRGARVRPTSDEDLEDTYLTRLTLEGTLTRRAAARFDATDAAEARQALTTLQQLIDNDDDPAAIRQAHKNFHYRIYQAAGSTWLLRSTEPTWHNSERYRAPSMADKDMLLARNLEHEAILNSCVTHQPQAAQQALNKHLLHTVTVLNPDVAQRLTRLLADDDSHAPS